MEGMTPIPCPPNRTERNAVAGLFAVISGVVLDHDGTAMPEARVSFAAGPDPLPDIAALTDSHGRFQLSAPGSGRYTLAVTADGSDGLIRQTIDVKVDGNRVRRTMDVLIVETG
jgi:hypothetical protein